MRKSTGYTIAAVVALLLTVAGSVVGGLLLITFGADDRLESLPTSLVGTGSAVIGDRIAVQASDLPLPKTVGTLTLQVQSPTGQQLFVGSAQPADLDTYLTGVPYDVITDLVPGGTAKVRPVPGSQTPPPPSAQNFWVRNQVGSSVSLKADLGDGTSLVVMNSDASAGVAATVRVLLTVPGAWVTGWIVVGIAGLLLVVAVLLLYRAAVARRRFRERESLIPPAGSILPGVNDVAATEAVVSQSAPAEPEATSIYPPPALQPPTEVPAVDEG